MTGFTSGRLRVIRFHHTKNKRAYWLCKCKCGRQRICMGKYLRKLQVKSCGCLHRKPIAGPKHGHSPSSGWSKTYGCWVGIIQRCTNSKNSKWRRYGGRGIGVCESWMDFRNFLKDMGEKPQGKSIDRIDNDGSYCPENCRWATVEEQAANTPQNRWIEHNGIRRTLARWARSLGRSPSGLHSRLKRLPLSVALTNK